MNELYCALVSLMEAARARDKAKDAYEGYSWGYAGQQYEDAVTEAYQRFQSGFKEAVREAIERLKNEPPARPDTPEGG
jgi:hypothetical protein